MRTTVTITKEANNIKSVELLYSGTSRMDVYVNRKKVSNNERKEALESLKGSVKTTTITKNYDMDWNLLNEEIKTENDDYMDLVKKAIQGYRARKYKY